MESVLLSRFLIVVDYLSYTTQASIILIIGMELVYSVIYHLQFRIIMDNTQTPQTQSTSSLLANPSLMRVAATHTSVNNAFVWLAFGTSLVGCILFPSHRDNLLFLPLLLLLIDDREDKEKEWMNYVIGKVRLLIPCFVVVSVVQMVFEFLDMKAHISKPNSDLFYYLLTDLKIRRIREVLLFLTVTPSYYSAFCLSSGFYYMNDTFVAIFGLLCIVGLFAETRIGRLYAALGLVSSGIQYVYVRIQERESLKYI